MIYSIMYSPDKIIKSVIDKFLERGELGLKKYGTTLDRDDLQTLDWINHAQEELMDGILYLEKLKQSIILEKEKKEQDVLNNHFC